MENKQQGRLVPDHGSGPEHVDAPNAAVAVTQADKDIAAEYSRRFPEIRLNEAFAAHRIQSTAELKAQLDMAVEALNDSQATLASIRASTVSEDWGEQSTSEHIHDLCGEIMRSNMAAIQRAKT